MQKKYQQKVAIFFTILFMAIISAPSIIMSIDDSVDITCFYGENEEEESLKLLFEVVDLNSESHFLEIDNDEDIEYTFKTYPKPHLNLIFPPPDFI